MGFELSSNSERNGADCDELNVVAEKPVMIVNCEAVGNLAWSNADFSASILPVRFPFHLRKSQFRLI